MIGHVLPAFLLVPGGFAKVSSTTKALSLLCDPHKGDNGHQTSWALYHLPTYDTRLTCLLYTSDAADE